MLSDEEYMGAINKKTSKAIHLHASVTNQMQNKLIKYWKKKEEVKDKLITINHFLIKNFSRTILMVSNQHPIMDRNILIECMLSSASYVPLLVRGIQTMVKLSMNLIKCSIVVYFFVF